MSDQQAEEPRQVRPFAAFLREHSNTHDEMSTALQSLVEAVMRHGKGGSLSLTLTVKPFGKGDERVLSVSDKIVVKAPAGERAERVFFSDAHGNLTRNDPRQLNLPGMTVVDGGALDYDDETGEVIEHA